MKSLILTLILLSFPLVTLAGLQVVTTTPDLAAIVREVGEDKVEVFSIGKGTQDPHQIEAKPSFMVKMRNTDLVIAQGLALESAWVGSLIQGSRNSKLIGKDAVLELAGQLDPIEVSQVKISRAEGDVHPDGNPHFQLDPIRLGQASLLIAKRMGELDPAQKEFYYKNAEKYQSHLVDKSKEWAGRLKKSRVTEIVTYHKTFAYFCDRFQIQCRVQLEPKPGMPPTASHILSVIDQMKKRNIRLVLIENLYNDSVKSKLEEAVTGVKVFRVPVLVQGEPSINTNEQLIENLVKIIEGNK